MSGFLYLADDSPSSTLVTASQLHSGRLDARDLSGVRSDRRLGDKAKELRELRGRVTDRRGKIRAPKQEAWRKRAADFCPAERFQGHGTLAQACPTHPATAGRGRRCGQAQSTWLGCHTCSLAYTFSSPPHGPFWALRAAHQPRPLHGLAMAVTEAKAGFFPEGATRPCQKQKPEQGREREHLRKTLCVTRGEGAEEAEHLGFRAKALQCSPWVTRVSL